MQICAQFNSSRCSFLSVQTELLTRCLILRNGNGNTLTFSMHRMVKSELICRLIPEGEKYQEAFFKMLNLVRAVVPHISLDTPSISFTDRCAFARYLPHVLCLDDAHAYCDQAYAKAKDNLVFAELLSDVGNYLLVNGSFNEIDLARKLHQKALETRTSLLGYEHPSSLTSMVNLASTYRKQERVKQAKEMEEQVIRSTSIALENPNPSMLISMVNLASTYSYHGLLAEAEALTLRVARTQSQTPEAEHPESQNGKSEMLRVEHPDGQNDQPEAVHSDSQIDQSNLMGAEHSDSQIGQSKTTRAEHPGII